MKPVLGLAGALVCLPVLLVSAGQPAAQTVSPEIVEVLDGIADVFQFERENRPDRLPVTYGVFRANLGRFEPDVPGVALYMLMADMEFSGQNALTSLDQAVAILDKLERGEIDEETASAAVKRILVAMEVVGSNTAGRATDNAELAKLIDRLSSLGLFLELPGSQLLSDAAKWGQAGLSASQLQAEDAASQMAFIKNAMGFIPATAAPALSGPAGAAFTSKLEWDQKMWSASTSVLDLVASAIETGVIDRRRLAALTGDIEKLATQGPWGAETAKDFLKQLVGSLPAVGNLFKALWPAAEVAACRAINCDCQNLDFGILTGPYRQECRAAEQTLIQRCQTAGQVEGRCHPTASGPNAHP